MPFPPAFITDTGTDISRGCLVAECHRLAASDSLAEAQGAPHLALLDMSFNHLLKLPELLPLVCLPGLQDVRLNGNPVQELPGYETQPYHHP